MHRTPLTLAGGVLTALALAAPASAAQVGLSGGTTSLALDPGAARALTSLGVRVAPTAPAKVSGGRIGFPITGGRIDPATGHGTYRHTGGLRLSAGSTRVTLSDFNVVVDDSPTMSAKVNGGPRVGLLTPVVSRARLTRPGVDTTVSNVSIQLSAKGAAALNATFEVKAFRRGLKLGTATVASKAADIAFTGGATELALDPGTAAALTSLGVSAAPAAPATATSTGALAFPINEGRVKAATLAGFVSHSGGITLSKGATSVTLGDFIIDTTRSTLTAALGSARADILALDLTKPALTVGSKSVTVGNVTAKLTQGAADALNAAFGTTAFTAGLTLGTATVKGTTA